MTETPMEILQRHEIEIGQLSTISDKAVLAITEIIKRLKAIEVELDRDLPSGIRRNRP